MSNNRGSGNAATPVITTASGQDIGAVSEDGTLKTSGRLSAVETGSSHPDLDWSVVGNGHGTYGSFSIDDNGKWSYVLNDKSDVVQSLAAGEHVSETFNVRVSDGHGGLATETVTIDVVGTNDAPEITGGTSSGAVKEDGTLSAGGHLNATDIDHGAQLSWSVVNGGAGSYGTLVVDQHGNWTYQLDNDSAAVQSLRGSDKVTDTFVIKVTDEFGASDTQTVTVKIQGSDDAPIIVGTLSGAVIEDGTATASGQLSIHDIDRHDSRDDDHRDDGHGNDGEHGDNHDHDGWDHDHHDGDHDDGSAWSVVGGGAGTYGTLSVDATGKWTYTLNDGAANVQALSAGESHTETFTVQVRVDEHDEDDGHDDHDGHDNHDGHDHDNHDDHDDHGGHDHDDAAYITQIVTVTVTGTNDAPVVTSTAQFGAVQEDSVYTATGQVTASDVDHLDTLSYAVVGDGNGAYGSLAVDSASGAWTYTLNNAAANVQALAQGESHVETFTVQVSDGQGGFTSQDVVVTVTGTNDAPVITSSAQAGAAQEDTTLAATGQVAASDVDNGAVLSYAVVGDGNGAYGSLAVDSATGAWTYSLNNNDPTVQALAQGESHVETFTVQVTDDQGATTTQDVAVTVTGTNDAPVITSSAQTGAVEEDSVLAATGQVTASDIDHLDVLSYAVAGDGNGTYGSLAVDPATGQWTYTLNNGDSNVQALAQGETAQDSFTVQVSDGNGGTTSQEVDVTIAGTNDAPVATNVSATADQNTPVTLGLNYYDPDTTDTDTVTLFETVNFSSSGSALGSLGSTEHDVTDGYLQQGGHAVLNGDGTVTFDPGHDFDYLGAGQTQDVVFDYRVTDNFGATTTATIDVTVTGENDTPVAYDTTATADQNTPTTVYLPWYEPDQNDTDTVTLFESFGGSSASSGYFGDSSGGSFGGSEHDFTDGYLHQGGHATLNADGTVTFDPGHAFDYLGAGQTQDVVFGYRVTDSFGATTTATIDVTVTGENDAPVAYDTTATADQNTATTVYLPWYEPDQNDTDTVTLFETVNFSSSGSLGGSTEHDFTDGYLQQGGHAVLNADGTVTFDPGHDFDWLGAGQTTDVVFDYRVTDAAGATTTATIDVTVTGENDAPVITSSAQDASGTVQAVHPATTFSGTMTADNQFAIYVSSDDSQLGTLLGTGNNWGQPFVFNAASLTQGTTNYIHIVATNVGGPGGVLGSFSLSDSNFAFTNGSTVENTTAADWKVSLTGFGSNYQTPVNEGLNTTGVTPWSPLSGISSASDWMWSYDSHNGGNDTFTEYFSMQISSVNPSAMGHLTASDVDTGATQSWSVVGSATGAYGSLAVDANTGVWSYALNNNSNAVVALGAGQTADDSFTVRVTDDHGATADQVVTVHVTGINDAPTAVNDTVATNEDTAVSIAVLANDTDPDAGDTKTLLSVTSASHGTAVVSGDHVLYTPGANYDGADSFTYTMQDAAGVTSTATVNLTVNPVTDTYTLSNLVTNGSFENGMTGWTQTLGGVDNVASSGWQPADGTHSLDMNGFSPGGIHQTLSTVAGVQYTVGFDLSKNPGNQDHATLVASVDNAAHTSQTYTDSDANSATNMLWTQQTFTFTATGSSTTLDFTSTYPSGFSFPFNAEGPALDEVVVVTNQVIGGFTNGASGGDVIDLSGLMSSVSAPHDSTAFSLGFLNFQQSGNDTLVQIDSNGGGDHYLTVATLTAEHLTQADTHDYLL